MNRTKWRQNQSNSIKEVKTSQGKVVKTFFPSTNMKLKKQKALQKLIKKKRIEDEEFKQEVEDLHVGMGEVAYSTEGSAEQS